MNRHKLIRLIVVCATFFLTTASLVAQEHSHSRNGTDQFPDLEAGLRQTEGCLGVETAQTTSGKQVIFAWFEDKQAVLNWYYSDMHRGVMKAFFPDQPQRTPMPDVPDDLGPIMAIASVTFSDKAHFQETKLPISQIAIELYTPVTGGIFLGSRFAPEGVKVSNLRELTPKSKSE